MSATPVWVRARDGALYKDPVIAFAHGLVSFTDKGPELAIWLPFDDIAAGPPCDITVELERLFGSYPDQPCACGAHLDSIGFFGRAMRAMPGADPPQFAPAIIYIFHMNARIPRPTVHAGSERYPGRCAGIVHELPASTYDAGQMEIPEEA